LTLKESNLKTKKNETDTHGVYFNVQSTGSFNIIVLA